MPLVQNNRATVSKQTIAIQQTSTFSNGDQSNPLNTGWNGTPLDAARRYGHTEVVRLLEAAAAGRGGRYYRKNYQLPIYRHFSSYRQIIDIRKNIFWNYRKIIDIEKSASNFIK